MYKFIFWDLDGTIGNTMEGVRNCLNYGLEPFGVQIEEGIDNIRKFIGPPLRKSIPEHLGFNEEETMQIIDRYRERYIPIGVFECEMFPGVVEAMTRLHDAGCVQIITSSKPTPQCLDVLKMFGIADRLDEVVGATLDGRIDTKIEVLNEAFRILKEKYPDYSKANTILIGDTKFDAMGAQEAGIKCIGVSYGFGTPEELLEHGVISVHENLDQVCDKILAE